MIFTGISNVDGTVSFESYDIPGYFLFHCIYDNDLYLGHHSNFNRNSAVFLKHNMYDTSLKRVS